MTRYEKMSQLFNEDYRVIDFLPGRASDDAETLYEEVEQYVCAGTYSAYPYKGRLAEG